MAYKPTTVYVTNTWGVDHTSVVVGDLQFGCSGDVGKENDRKLFSGINLSVDERSARTIGAYDPNGTRLNYDRTFWDLKHIADPNPAFLPFGDCCGAIYGINGVCHTMANRILMAASLKATVNFALGSRSGKLSWFLYGYYGRGAILPYVNVPIAWTTYMSICQKAESTANSENGFSTANIIYNIKLEEAEQEAKLYIQKLLRELESSNSGNDEFYKSVMRHELTNIDSKDLAKDRIAAFLKANLDNASNSDTYSVLDSFGKVEEAMKYAETLCTKQINQFEMNNIVGYAVTQINEELRKFDKDCYDSLGTGRYRSVFGEDYKPGIIVINTKREEEKGLFSKRFTYEQVFDCMREPWYPVPGKAFKASHLKVPFSFLTILTELNVKNKIFYFEGTKGANDSIAQLSLWMADDANKTNAKCIVANGSIYGLNTYGIFYESDVRFGSEGYGYLISPVKPLNYGSSWTWQPTVGKVTTFSDLEEYGNRRA